MKITALYLAMLFILPVCLALSAGEYKNNTRLTHLISDYRVSLASLPLDYSLVEKNSCLALCFTGIA